MRRSVLLALLGVVSLLYGCAQDGSGVEGREKRAGEAQLADPAPYDEPVPASEPATDPALGPARGPVPVVLAPEPVLARPRGPEPAPAPEPVPNPPPEPALDNSSP